MEEWEDWDKVDEKDLLPIFIKNTNDNKKEKPETKNTEPTSFLSDSALRAAHPYYEAQPTVKILARNNISNIFTFKRVFFFFSLRF
jgi:hypothetical protein